MSLIYFEDIVLTEPSALWTDERAYNTIQEAINAIGPSEQTLLISRPITCIDLTIPPNISLLFTDSGSISNSGTLTIQTRNITSGDHQIFSGLGPIVFPIGIEIRSTWFADLQTAITSTQSSTLTLVIANNHIVTTSCSVGDNVVLKWESPNIIEVSPGITISNISNIIAGNYKIFEGSGIPNFVTGTSIKSAWFPTLRLALASQDSNKSKVYLTKDGSLTSDFTENLSGVDLVVKKGKILTLNGITTINFNIIVEDGGQVLVDQNCTISGNVRSEGSFSSVIAFDAVTGDETLTLNGSVDAGLWQIFGYSLKVKGSSKINVVYPEWFGVGSGDDSVSIQRAITMLPSQTQTADYPIKTGRIRLPSQVYNLQSSIDLLDGEDIHPSYIIEGNTAHENPILLCGFSGIALSLSSTYERRGPKIQNIDIDGNNRTVELAGLVIDNIASLVLDNVRFLDINGSGIKVNSNLTDSYFSNVTINRCGNNTNSACILSGNSLNFDNFRIEEWYGTEAAISGSFDYCFFSNVKLHGLHVVQSESPAAIISGDNNMFANFRTTNIASGNSHFVVVGNRNKLVNYEANGAGRTCLDIQGDANAVSNVTFMQAGIGVLLSGNNCSVCGVTGNTSSIGTLVKDIGNNNSISDITANLVSVGLEVTGNSGGCYTNISCCQLSYRGIILQNVDGASISNFYVSGTGETGFLLRDSKDINVSNFCILDSGETGFFIYAATANCENIKVTNGTSKNKNTTNQLIGLRLLGSDFLTKDVIIKDMDLNSNTEYNLLIDKLSSENVVIRNCNGYVTRNHGQSSILNGNSSVQVTHGLELGSADMIFLTPKDTELDDLIITGNDTTVFEVSRSGGATVSADRQFFWEAVRENV